MILEGKRIYLRKLSASDVADICKGAGKREISRYTLHIPYPYKKIDAERFIRRSQRKWREKKAFVFGIILREEQRLIGMIDLTDVSSKHKKAEIGYWLAKEYWREGIMSEAVRLILGFAFGQLKLEKVYAKVFHPNKASSGLLKKSGFKHEGTLRREFAKDGHLYDLVCYGILKSEFRKLKSKG